MQANKYTITIEVEVLSLDSAPTLLYESIMAIEQESRTGSLLKEDGNYVKWLTKSERVDF